MTMSTISLPDTGSAMAFDAATVLEAQSLIEAVKRSLSTDRRSAEAGLMQLTRLFRRQEPARAAPERGRLPEWQRRLLDRYIEDNLDGSLDCPRLAALVGLSRSYFASAFKVTFGDCPRAYVIRRRIVRAQALMLDTRGSLSEIALEVGFADQAHFTRHFGRLIGETPAAWRRACGAAGQASHTAV